MTTPADDTGDGSLGSEGGLDTDWFRAFVERFEWTFAKTMPQDPHWYIRRRQVQDDDLFDAVVMAIRRHGYSAPYKGRWYTCVDVDGWKYWTMGAPLHSAACLQGLRPDADHTELGCTFILNRARL